MVNSDGKQCQGTEKQVQIPFSGLPSRFGADTKYDTWNVLAGTIYAKALEELFCLLYISYTRTLAMAFNSILGEICRFTQASYEGYLRLVPLPPSCLCWRARNPDGGLSPSRLRWLSWLPRQAHARHDLVASVYSARLTVG